MHVLASAPRHGGRTLTGGKQLSAWTKSACGSRGSVRPEPARRHAAIHWHDSGTLWHIALRLLALPRLCSRYSLQRLRRRPFSLVRARPRFAATAPQAVASLLPSQPVAELHA